MSAEDSLLIDFSSPAVKDNRKPLIPVPCINIVPIVSPVEDNPFDIVATQSEHALLQNDPFELVFKATKCLNATTLKCKTVLSCNNRSLSTSAVAEEFLHRDRSFKVLPKSSSSSSQSMDYLNRGFLERSTSSNDCVSRVVIEKSDSSDNVFLSNDELIFKEANKLADSFSEAANRLARRCQSPVFVQNTPVYEKIVQETPNFFGNIPILIQTKKNKGSGSEDDNDLMSCKPPDFLYGDSSEDEAERLRRDPSLNFHSSTASLGLSQSFMSDNKPNLDSEALFRFKNRCKGLSMEDEEKPSKLAKYSLFQRSTSWDATSSRTVLEPCLHDPVPVAVVHPEEAQDIKQLRVKKVLAERVRRGPLRAIMPIWNMTKPVENKEKNCPKEKEMSAAKVIPARKGNLKVPIATSTPNRSRCESLPTNVSPIRPAVTKQRRSLNSRNLSTIPTIASMKRSSSLPRSVGGVSKAKPLK